MKKSILLALALLLTCSTVKAVDWQYVETNSYDTELYIDADSIRKGSNSGEYLYAVKFSKGGSLEKVVYVKSDYKNNLIGIIWTEDYDKDTYRPSRNLTNPHVYMKHLDDDKVIYLAHEQIASLIGDDRYAKNLKNNEVIPVNYTREDVVLRDFDNAEVLNNNEVLVSNSGLDATQSYLVKTCQMIDANWFPPKTQDDTITIVLASIGRKGDIISYNFLQSSGDELTDKSVIDALYRTKPYLPLPTDDSKIGSMEFKFVFHNSASNKRVVY